MHWNSLIEFLAMGGYGLYVWGSFGITFLCMVIEIFLVRQRSQLANAQTLNSNE